MLQVCLLLWVQGGELPEKRRQENADPCFQMDVILLQRLKTYFVSLRSAVSPVFLLNNKV